MSSQRSLPGLHVKVTYITLPSVADKASLVWHLTPWKIHVSYEVRVLFPKGAITTEQLPLVLFCCVSRRRSQ